MKPDLEVRTSIISALSITILAFAGLAVFIFLFLCTGTNLQRWGFNFFTVIVLITQVAFSLVQLLRLLDRRPILRITGESIWVRENTLPFSKTYFIPIETIYFYHILNTYKRNVSKSQLYIRQKDNLKDYKVSLDGIDKQVTQITDTLKFYADQYQFYDFGEEDVKGEFFD